MNLSVRIPIGAFSNYSCNPKQFLLNFYSEGETNYPRKLHSAQIDSTIVSFLL